MKGAQAAGVLPQALRDGEEQLAGAVAQSAHQECRVAQVPRIRLVRHLVPAQHSSKYATAHVCEHSNRGGHVLPACTALSLPTHAKVPVSCAEAEAQALGGRTSGLAGSESAAHWRR